MKLVISDAHTGLTAAVDTVFAAVPKAVGPMVASIIRTIFAQPDAEHVFTQFHEVVRMLTRSHPKVAGMLEDAQDDLLAFCQFPFQHWRQIWSTSRLERVNKGVKRRTDVVDTFPNPAVLLRLAGHVLIEQHDEWDGADRRTSASTPWPCYSPNPRR